MKFLFLFPLAYLWASIPWGLLVARVYKRVDLREYGSGKIGMTNVIRTVGIKAGILVLVLDLLKGMLPMLLARILSHSPEVESAVGVASIAGHNWSVFIGFQGGSGILTGLGALLIISPIAGGAALAVAVSLIAITRYVSLGSLVGAPSGAIIVVILGILGDLHIAYTYFAIISLAAIALRHRANIKRLMQGKEHRLGQKAQQIQHQEPSGGG